MKHHVTLSTYNILLTLVVVIAFTLLHYTADNAAAPAMTLMLSIMIIALLCCTLYYMPTSVELVGDSLTVHRPLKSLRIPVSEISSIEMCAPTMAARTICGSGGFLGYWGRFYEKDLGRYFAYHGKASDCFLVTLRSGRRYMLGCRDASQLVEAVKSAI